MRNVLLVDWLIRAICITPILIVLALICKSYLIEPHSISVIEFEMKWQAIKYGGKWI